MSSGKLETPNSSNFHKESPTIKSLNTAKTYLTDSENGPKLITNDQI